MGTEALTLSPDFGFAHDAIDLGQSAIEVLSSSKMWQHVIVALSVAAIVVRFFNILTAFVYSRAKWKSQCRHHLVITQV
jgi:hypothetical protein